MNMQFILFIFPAGAIFCIIMSIYKATLERRVQARERIQDMMGALNPILALPESGILVPGAESKKDENVLKNRQKDKNSPQARLEQDLERANLLIRPNEFLIFKAVTTFIGALFAFILFGHNWFFAILGGVLGFFCPPLYLKVRIWLRLNRAASQFADVLDVLVNCFKTGYAFSRAIQVIAQNFEDPWGTEFSKLAMEMNLGAKQDTALYNLATRIPLPDVDMFVIALVIQKETGGNMAEMLQNLSKTCRERYKLFRKVKAISAQGKLSATIVALVPFFLMLLMYVFLPGPVTEFVTNPIGMIVMGLAMIWMIMGICTLFKIVRIEV